MTYLILFVNACITAIGATSVALALSLMKKLRAERKKKAEISADEYDILKKAVKALTHDALHRYCRYLLPKDELTEDEVENLNFLYRSYESLGLNGTGKKLYEQVMEKPLNKEN